MAEPPEQKACRTIDEKLTASGWLVQNREDIDLTARRGIAVRECPMKSGFGYADSLQYLDRKALGAVEANAVGTLTERDFEVFVACYQPDAMHKRKPTWSEGNPDGRWRSYDYDEILKRDTLSLDLFWIKDQSLTDTDSLPAPQILATELADELEAACDLFAKIAELPILPPE